MSANEFFDNILKNRKKLKSATNFSAKFWEEIENEDFLKQDGQVRITFFKLSVIYKPG